MKLEEYLVKEIRGQKNAWHTPQIGKYHASQIYEICTGMKPEKFFKEKVFTDEELLTLELGKMYHAHISTFFKPEEQDVAIRIQRGSYEILGKMDLYVDQIPLELKTCSKFPKTPYKAHRYQLQCYMSAVNASHGFLIYILKDQRTIKTKTFRIVSDPQVMEEIHTKVGQFHALLTEVYQGEK